jgi:transmembrane sensor
MMDESLAKDLFQKYKDGTLTDQEMALLESWYIDLAKSATVTISTDDLEKNLDMVWKSLPVNENPVTSKKGRVRPLLKWLAVAASVTVIGTIGLNFFYKQKIETKVKNVAVVQDAVPGDNRAKLTLSNGQSIMLHEAGNGKLAQQGQTSVIKTKQGEIVYEFDMQESDANVELVTYNTIATPKAGQYQVKLPDGTRVWLNAASSIHFPTVFPANERVVEIIGEAYFEVAKVLKNSKRVPFKVKAGNQVVEVLGTRFNVNSYADEAIIQTTLLEGSIKLKVAGKDDQGILLKPGEQALLARNSRKSADVAARPFKVKQVDTRSVIAWKEGYFRFNNVGLPELMRQLSRWYDMEVVYEGAVKEYEFVGQIERNTNLSKVLQILELGDVHFRIENKKIVVTD